VVFTYITSLCLRGDLLLLQGRVIIALAIVLVQGYSGCRTVLLEWFFSLKLFIFVLFINISLLLLLLCYSVGNNWLLLRALRTIFPQDITVSVLGNLLTLGDRSLRDHAPSIFISSLRSCSHFSRTFLARSTISLLHLAILSIVIVSHIRLNPN
jgi:hypothetical protein